MPAALTFEEVLAGERTGARCWSTPADPRSSRRATCAASINVGLEGRFAEYAGTVVPPDVASCWSPSPASELEAKNRLARIGFDRVVGALDEPDEAFVEHQRRRPGRLAAHRHGARAPGRRAGRLQVVDVRNPGEVAAGTIPGAIPIPLGQLLDRLDELDPGAPTVVYCAGGYRSSVAASLLRANGFGDVSDILGGYAAWDEAHQNA